MTFWELRMRGRSGCRNVMRTRAMAEPSTGLTAFLDLHRVDRVTLINLDVPLDAVGNDVAHFNHCGTRVGYEATYGTGLDASIVSTPFDRRAGMSPSSTSRTFA
jgi:hypothetical protein